MVAEGRFNLGWFIFLNYIGIQIEGLWRLVMQVKTLESEQFTIQNVVMESIFVHIHD